METFWALLSTLAGGVCEQWLGLLFCIGSIGVCTKSVYFLRKSKMADGHLEVFRHALLSRGFFAHVAPLRSRPGVASVIWESLVLMRRCSQEESVNNCSAQLLSIYIDYISVT